MAALTTFKIGAQLSAVEPDNPVELERTLNFAYITLHL